MSRATPSAAKHRDQTQRRKHTRRRMLRDIRIQRGLTQKRLGELSGLHRNSIRKIENGLTREITAEHAEALAAALQITVGDLDLHVRTAVEAPSIRLRQLTPEQRQIVNDVLALPPADYLLLRAAMEHLRAGQSRVKRRRGGR